MKRIVMMLVLCSALTANAADKPVRRYIGHPRTGFENLPFSEGVLAGDTLYIAGHIGTDDKTGKVPATVAEEITNLLNQFDSVLKEANMTMDDLVQVTVYCPDLKLYDQFNAAYRTRFKKEFPARAFIGSGALLRGGHFEMVGIAVRR